MKTRKNRKVEGRECVEEQKKPEQACCQQVSYCDCCGCYDYVYCC